MPVLRINQQRGDAPHHYQIEITATEIPNFAPLKFSRDIAFELTPQDGERIRWYLEDYLQFDEDPAPQIARDVEALMAACGDGLFRSLFGGRFEGDHQGIQLWTMIEPHLSATRVEITTGISEATAIPWELIRNPHTGTFLALSADSFVRTQRETQITLARAAASVTSASSTRRHAAIICATMSRRYSRGADPTSPIPIRKFRNVAASGVTSAALPGPTAWTASSRLLQRPRRIGDAAIGLVMQVLACRCHRLAQPAAARERTIKLGHELRGGHDINRITHGDHAGGARLHYCLRQRAIGFDLRARRFGLSWDQLPEPAKAVERSIITAALKAAVDVP